MGGVAARRFPAFNDPFNFLSDSQLGHEPHGGAAPVGMLDTFFNRGSSWGGGRPFPAIRRVAGTLPALMVAADRVAATVIQGVHGRRRVGQGDAFWQYRPYRERVLQIINDIRREEGLPLVSDR